MEIPAVQYVTTSDGIQLAYAVAGDGEPIVQLPFHYNHVLLRWTVPLWFRGLAKHFHVAHYDGRGQGLSSRNLTRQQTTADLRRDLEAIIDATGFDRFALMAYGGFGHVALRYAVENPERVTALVLICTSETFEAWSPAAHLGIAEENWDLFIELQAKNTPPQFKEVWKNFIRDSTTQADYAKLVRAFIADPSVSHLLPRVNVPTLFLHSLDQHWLPPAEGARMASKIVGARILFTDGDVEPDQLQAVPAIISFLEGIGPESSIGPQPRREAIREGNLSRRQLEVLQLIAEGKRTREIAQALVLSERTVERHIAGIYAKIGARNRSEATAFVLGRPSVLDGAKHPITAA